MDREELIERLKGYEWNDVEFKRAQRGVPDSAYETVAAFSNTEGGWLVFGVRDAAGGFEIVGVLEVDKVQNDFLSVLRSGQKLNRVIAAKERLIEDNGKALLVFHIPEARRQDKPIYLGGDIRRSYIRRGAGDERCTETEIERLLRDAADERYDGQPLEGAETPVFVVAEHLKGRLGRTDQVGDQVGARQPDLITAQVPPRQEDLSTAQVESVPSRLVTDQAAAETLKLVTDQARTIPNLGDLAWKIVTFCDVPRSLADIMRELGLTHRTFFRRNHLEPLLAGGVLRMIHPERPNHPDQAYVLTEAGVALKAHRVNGDTGMDNEGPTNGA